MSIVPEFSSAFCTSWLLAAMAGEIAGRALNHIYVHRSRSVIVAQHACNDRPLPVVCSRN
jgi:hypothetical protein